MSKGAQQEHNFSFSANLMPYQTGTNLINQLISQHRAAALPHHWHCLLPQGSNGQWRKDSLKGARKPVVRDEGADLGKGRVCGDVEHKFVDN